MRIISKYQDYYDCMQKMEQHDHHGPTSDVKSVTSDLRPWIREKIEVETQKVDLEFNFPYIKLNTHNMPNTVNIGTFIVGFCGKVYPGIQFSWSETKRVGVDNQINYKEIKEHCYCIEEVDKVVDKLYKKKIFTKKEYDFYHETRKKKLKTPYNSYWERNTENKTVHFHRVHLVEVFNRVEKSREGFDPFFELEKSPIFTFKRKGKWPVSEKDYIVFNSKLKDYQFYRVFDAARAWQEITMYLSNMCFPEVVPNPISDVLKAETHGFDKFSFRKDPQNKK